MRIAVSGKGTYKARQTLKSHGLRWIREKHAWMGDVDRLTVTLVREYMKQIPNIQLVFDSPAEESEYYGHPYWECPTCKNIIRPSDCSWTDGKVTYRCPYCNSLCRFEEE